MLRWDITNKTGGGEGGTDRADICLVVEQCKKHK